MTKKLLVTKNQITAALKDATFVPSKPGPLKVIVDVGDYRYYMVRARELLVFASQSPSSAQCLKYLDMALSLIAISKVRIQNARNETQTDQRS